MTTHDQMSHLTDDTVNNKVNATVNRIEQGGKPNLPPAISLPLTGQYLIEASAGTGKTWTLTGVLLRLLVEAGQPSDRIIATTFTRSAAAEMRQRVRERLQDFVRLLRLVPDNLLPIVNRAANITDAKRRLTRRLKRHAPRYGLASAVKDPINVYLIELIATQTLSRSNRFKPAQAVPEQTFNQVSESNTASHTVSHKVLQTVSNTDPINQQAEPPTVAPAAKPPLDFRLALQRTQMALSQLDRLFISTLDSLCQKWLREYSSETGFSADMQISNNVKPVIMGMIHDQLRAFWAQLYQHEPELYRLMQAQGRLLNADDFYPAVEKALNFYTAPIVVESPAPFDLDELRVLMQALADFGDKNFAVYFDQDYRLAQGFTVKGKLNTRFEFFQQMQQLFNGRDLSVLLGLEKSHKAIYELLQEVAEFKTTGKSKGFKGKHEVQRDQFLGFSVIDMITALFAKIAQLQAHIDQINGHFTQFISRYVRDQLPNVLEAQQITTFSLQLARLNQALAGQHGAGLARYIRHQYPVALIDESQDINTEQALLIERIYLAQRSDPSNASQPRDNSFLLLVGDPKQAIYGFRGGDVSNYTTLKKLMPTQPLALNENRRSVATLIDTLNHWYGVALPLSDQSLSQKDSCKDSYIDSEIDSQPSTVLPSYLGEAIVYQPMTATRKNPALMSQLSDNQTSLEPHNTQNNTQNNAENNVQNKAQPNAQNLPAFFQLSVTDAKTKTAETAADVLIDNAFNTDDAVTWAILSLMDDTAEHPALYLEENPLQLSDICVLATKHRHLDSLERKLQRAGIATLRGGNQSVFGEQMSQDLLSLMLVLLSPHHLAKLKTVLLSSFFQLTLAQANALLDSEQQTPHDPTTHGMLNAIQQLVLDANEHWQKEGFLVAIQWLLNQSLTLPNQPTSQPALSFWQRLANHPMGERLLIDLRHILDIISEQAANQVIGEYQLIDWLKNLIYQQPTDDWAIQQRLPSETGVNLMTVHQSKGLEFPIVFIMGMDDPVKLQKSNAPLFSYHLPNTASPLKSRQLTPLRNKVQKNGEIQDFEAGEHQALFEEKLRLLYVALTRARERVYLVTQTRNIARDHTALTAYISDNKTFALRKDLQEHIPCIDINSLSKYHQNSYQEKQLTAKFSPEIVEQIKHHETKIYQKNFDKIQQQKFQGWANISFTALSRLFHREQQALAVHTPDYDELEILEKDEPFKTAQIDVSLNLNTDTKNPPLLIEHGAKDHTDGLITAQSQPSQPVTLEDLLIMEQWQQDSAMFEMSVEPSNTDLLHDDIGNNMRDNDVQVADFLFEMREDMDFEAPQTARVGVSVESVVNEESQLMRFTFERGTGAGTFLHKVLEDLANTSADENQGSISDDGKWKPSARWGVIIDRALRQQQLPARYFSTLAASEEGFQRAHAHTDAPLQPEFLALSDWLSDVIQTPFAATGQRPIDIKPQQKSAEMGFNMRLQNHMPLESLNVAFLKSLDALFKQYDIPLQLQTDFAPPAIWQYLRGEIDLVYQHNNRYYVVDYKSNYLGDNFAAYHTAALKHAMNVHGYWLQASIYQVALHRFLQLRLAHYDPYAHLGAVEYAFIRGMAPQFADYGRLVWQPPIEFILALDRLFGNPVAYDL